MKKIMDRGIVVMAAVLLAFLPGCEQPKVELKAYPLDTLDGVLAKDNVSFDPAVSADGKGSLKIAASGPMTVRLFETGDLTVDKARVTFQAKVKAENFQGKAYLEMWCRMPGQGEFFSRGLDRPLMGSADWTTLETPFFLKKGEDPENIALNLVIEGTGTVWIDDIRLIKGPLK
jgi:hypothetical protein